MRGSLTGYFILRALRGGSGIWGCFSVVGVSSQDPLALPLSYLAKEPRDYKPSAASTSRANEISNSSEPLAPISDKPTGKPSTLDTGRLIAMDLVCIRFKCCNIISSLKDTQDRPPI